MKNNVRKFRLAIATLTSALVLLTGCIKQKMLIKVKPDGSGNIVVSTMFSKRIVEAFDKQMEKQKEMMASKGMDVSKMAFVQQDPFFNEKQLKKSAVEFGENVEYVKAKKISNATGRGYIAIYSFKNIEDVKLDLKKISSPAPKFGNIQPSDDDSITFSLKKGAVAVLKVNIPQSGKKAEVRKESVKEGVIKPTPLSAQERSRMMAQGGMFGLTGKETTKEEVFRKMFADMSIDINLEVVGELIKSNATFKDAKKKNRCTLLAMDFGTLLESDKICSELCNDSTQGNFIEKIITTNGGVKGFKIEAKKEVTVEFK